MEVLLIGGPYDGRRIDVDDPQQMLVLPEVDWPEMISLAEPTVFRCVDHYYRPDKWRCEHKEFVIFVHRDIPTHDTLGMMLSGYKPWPGNQCHPDEHPRISEINRAQLRALVAGDHRSAHAIAAFTNLLSHEYRLNRQLKNRIDELEAKLRENGNAAED